MALHWQSVSALPAGSAVALTTAPSYDVTTSPTVNTTFGSCRKVNAR